MYNKARYRLVLVFSILIEVYRVFSGCLMVVFLANDCGNHPCNPIENVIGGDTLYRIGYWINLQTCCAMAALYYYETHRENSLRKYMWFNTHTALDSESVGYALSTLPDSRKMKLYGYHNRYRNIVYFVYFTYALNTILSGILIGREYLNENSRINDRSLIAFVTSVLFLGSKLYDTYTIVFVETNIFHSAYTKQHLQFNAIQETKKVPCLSIE